ncbi:stage V sporulation protein B [Anoxybacteroides amylolyticum]|uniref:Stage V sporulation protein B n=1 Tax=Anoxybacteroides amylolyticum TaxID=294699 RepID=A0A160F2C0_9BACL|nr:stage V sporulation protein B [Anoxybacillus amylolyticus]ANB60368.1 stage V sporulation protein B [Anoxybacillus amylolyticus]
MSKFLQGTIILIVAGLITRVLGFINRIVVARVIGEEGVGLYMMAVPTLVLAITLTQMGLPVAISKLVAEAETMGDEQKVKKILVVSLVITGTLSVLFFPAMVLLAPFLATTLFTDARTYYPLLAVAPVVPIVAVSSVLRGYFQGRQQMKPYAYSQLIEQIVRISLIAFCTEMFLPYGIEYAAAGAMFSAVLGELASLFYLVYIFKRKKPMKLRSQFFRYVKAGRETFIGLLRIAIPTTGSRLIGSIAWFLEPIVVARSLAIAGVATAAATKQYGELTGYALPLLMLPSFITYSLSTSLVPAISEAAAQRQPLLIEHRVQQGMRLSLITGGLAVVVLYVFADPIMLLMYGTSNAAVFVQVMAPFFLFYYCQGPLQAVLQGLDLAKAAMVNSFIGSAVKTACIFALATQPKLGIMGAALAIAIGTVLVTLLHFATIVQTISYSIYVLEYVYTLLTMAASGLIGHVAFRYWQYSLPINIRTLMAITVTTVTYIILLIMFNLVKCEELARLPFVRLFLRKKRF